MNFEYEIVYVKNKEYIYVLTINVDNDNVLDLSIFEIVTFNVTCSSPDSFRKFSYILILSIC
jgi:hypothetical protein